MVSHQERNWAKSPLFAPAIFHVVNFECPIKFSGLAWLYPPQSLFFNDFVIPENSICNCKSGILLHMESRLPLASIKMAGNGNPCWAR